MQIELSAPLGDEPESFDLDYDAGSEGGLAGLDGARVSDSVFVVGNETVIPTLLLATADIDVVILVFDQPLLEVEVALAWFTLGGDGVNQRVTAGAIDGDSVSLQLSAPLSDDPEVLELEYNAGSSSGLASLTGARR